MAAAPMTRELRADIVGHLDPIAGVVAAASQQHEVHVRTQVAPTLFRARLEAATAEDHAIRIDLPHPISAARDDAAHAAICVDQQLLGGGIIMDLDLLALGDGVEHFDQARTGPDRLDVGIAAREEHPPVALEGQFRIDRPFDSLLAHPADGVRASGRLATTASTSRWQDPPTGASLRRRRIPLAGPQFRSPAPAPLLRPGAP